MTGRPDMTGRPGGWQVGRSNARKEVVSTWHYAPSWKLETAAEEACTTLAA